MNSFDLIWGIVGTVCGIYCIVGWYRMVKKGIICTTVLLPKDINVRKCKNQEEYRKKAAPKLLVLGIALQIVGIFDFVTTYTETRTNLGVWISLGILLIVLVWFMITTSRLRKEYFDM